MLRVSLRDDAPRSRDVKSQSSSKGCCHVQYVITAPSPQAQGEASISAKSISEITPPIPSPPAAAGKHLQLLLHLLHGFSPNSGKEGFTVKCPPPKHSMENSFDWCLSCGWAAFHNHTPQMCSMLYIHGEDIQATATKPLALPRKTFSKQGHERMLRKNGGQDDLEDDVQACKSVTTLCFVACTNWPDHMEVGTIP